MGAYPERILSVLQYFSSEMHVLNWQISTDHVLSQVFWLLKTFQDLLKTWQVLSQVLTRTQHVWFISKLAKIGKNFFTRIDLPRNQIVFQLAEKFSHDWHLSATSEVYSSSIKWTLWKCSCCLVLLFELWRIFKQATVSVGLHQSLTNENKPTKKLCSIRDPRLVKSRPRLAQDLLRLAKT